MNACCRESKGVFNDDQNKFEIVENFSVLAGTLKLHLSSGFSGNYGSEVEESGGIYLLRNEVAWRAFQQILKLGATSSSETTILSLNHFNNIRTEVADSLANYINEARRTRICLTENENVLPDVSERRSTTAS